MRGDSFLSKSSMKRLLSNAPTARQARIVNVIKGQPVPTSHAKQRVPATGDSSLTSYKCKKDKVVVVLSAMLLSYGTFGQEPNKLSEAIDFYNKTKAGVDCADQMIETFSTKFSTRRWPVMLFCNLLDFAALNAYVLHEKLKLDNATVLKRRRFLKKLGKRSLS